MIPLCICSSFIESGFRLATFIVRGPFSNFISVLLSSSYVSIFCFFPFLSFFRCQFFRFSQFFPFNSASMMCFFSWWNFLIFRHLCCLCVKYFRFRFCIFCSDGAVWFSLLSVGGFWGNLPFPSSRVSCVLSFVCWGRTRPSWRMGSSMVEIDKFSDDSAVHYCWLWLE